MLSTQKSTLALRSIKFLLPLLVLGCGRRDSSSSQVQSGLDASTVASSEFEKLVEVFAEQAGSEEYYASLQASAQIGVEYALQGEAIEIARVDTKTLLAESKKGMCKIIEGFLENRAMRPYYVYGGNVSKGAGVHEVGGWDIVYDLYNQEIAAFSYKGGKVNLSIGAGASTYLGYGFSKQLNVVSAWSGAFKSIDIGIETQDVPILNLLPPSLGAGVSFFTGADSADPLNYKDWNPAMIGATFSVSTNVRPIFSRVPLASSVGGSTGWWVVEKPMNKVISKALDAGAIKVRHSNKGELIRVGEFKGQAVGNHSRKAISLALAMRKINLFPDPSAMLYALAVGYYKDLEKANKLPKCAQ